MNGNSGRWLFVAACLVAVAAVVQDYRFDAAHRHLRGSAADFTQESQALRTKVAELRGGQTAYLATGQGPEFWMRRVTDLSNDIESGISRLKAEARTAEAGTGLTAASSALVELLAIDKRARQALDGDQRFLASDIVFAEGLTPTQALVDALSSASAAESAAIEAKLASDGRLRLAMMPSALMLVIGAGLVWAQSKRKESPASAAAAMAQMLRELPPPVKTAAPSAAPPTAAPPKPAPATPSVDLVGTAELCVDLARVLSSDDIPALLSRAAGVLNATGIVVWVSSETSDALVPALWHGYSDRVIGGLGALDTSTENITAVCFRSGRPQSVTGVGQPGAASAIAVPLVTAEGCHGVLSAELQVAKPANEAVAIARIIAAQLASMTVATAASAASGDPAVALG
jgi:hypothetical protein